MLNDSNPRPTMLRLRRYVDSFCGLYSKVARQLGIDRSFVSRVASGERRSDKVEGALIAEFHRIEGEGS